MRFGRLFASLSVATLLVSAAPLAAQAQMDRGMHHRAMRHHDRMMMHRDRMMMHRERMMHHRMMHHRMMRHRMRDM